jgi:serine protease Do
VVDEDGGSGLFLVQDHALRSAVMPLFAIDKRDLSERPKGRGTTFRIDPWSGCATAYHVVEELLEAKDGAPALREHVRLIALELEGIPYGAPAIRPEQWRNFEGMFAVSGVKSEVGRAPELRNVTELASLRIARSPGATGPGLYLGLDLRRWSPSVGDRVTAFGFADLDVGAEGEGSDDLRPISQEVYGSSATITDIEPADPARGRPWPFFRVDRDWPGGMSGGPVVNSSRHVIGIVSTGISFAATGSAVFFSGSSAPEVLFPQVDPSAPGQIYCWGGFGADGAVAMIAPTRDALMTIDGATELQNVGRMSYNTNTGDYICV